MFPPFLVSYWNREVEEGKLDQMKTFNSEWKVNCFFFFSFFASTWPAVVAIKENWKSDPIETIPFYHNIVL